MAAGSIKTPIILQQSGIGPANVLSDAGVEQLVALESVGMNLVDQTTTTTDWAFLAERGGGQPLMFPRFQVSYFCLNTFVRRARLFCRKPRNDRLKSVAESELDLQV